MLCDWEEGAWRPRRLSNFKIWFFLPTTPHITSRAGAWLHWPSSRGPGRPRYVWKREGFCQGKHLPCQADQQISYLLQPLHLNPWGAKACLSIKCKLRNYWVPSPENTEANVHKSSMCLSRVLKKKINWCFSDPESNGSY